MYRFSALSPFATQKTYKLNLLDISLPLRLNLKSALKAVALRFSMESEEFVSILFKVVRQCNKNSTTLTQCLMRRYLIVSKSSGSSCSKNLNRSFNQPQPPNPFVLGILLVPTAESVLPVAHSLLRLIRSQRRVSLPFGLTQTCRKKQPQQSEVIRKHRQWSSKRKIVCKSCLSIFVFLANSKHSIDFY